MTQDRSKSFFLIMPKQGNEKDHYSIKTALDFTNAAKVLLPRHKNIGHLPKLETVNEAKDYILDNYREHRNKGDEHDFGYESARECGEQTYAGQTLREYLVRRGMMERFTL